MACISLDGGLNFYNAFSIDLIESDIYKYWEQIEYQMDPDVRQIAEQNYGNRGLLIFLQTYLQYAPYDLIVHGQYF